MPTSFELNPATLSYTSEQPGIPNAKSLISISISWQLKIAPFKPFRLIVTFVPKSSSTTEFEQSQNLYFAFMEMKF